jgi:Uma2 family endonuclease
MMSAEREEMSTLQSRIAAIAEIYGQPHPGRRLSEREFDEWVEESTRAEWVDGEVVLMPPVSLDHDDAVWWLRSLVTLFVTNRELGSVHGPEVLVRFKKIRRKRLPDIAFVASGRADILKKKVIDGAPDLIIEAVSTDSIERDWIDKYDDYERAGVREYWVVDRLADRLECYKLGPDGRYRATRMREDRVPSSVLRGFYLRPSWLLDAKLKNLLEAFNEISGR